MYFITIVLLVLVLPAASVVAEARADASADLILLTGKWFVFWAGGVRLILAGVIQALRPEYTATSIFEIEDRNAHAIVREVGFGNLAMGSLAVLSLFAPAWTVPAAIVSGLYYGLAGVGHMARGARNAREQTALVTDFLVFAVLAVFVVRGALL